MNMEYNRPTKWIELIDTYSKKISLYYRGWNNLTGQNISKVLLIRYLDNFQLTILSRFKKKQTEKTQILRTKVIYIESSPMTKGKNRQGKMMYLSKYMAIYQNSQLHKNVIILITLFYF